MLTYSKELIFFKIIVSTTKALIVIAVETQHLVHAALKKLQICKGITDPFKLEKMFDQHS